MHPEIQKRFNDLEARRIGFVDRVRALPKEQQGARPGGNLFSPIEVVEHFALAEGASVAFLKRHPPETLAGKRPRTTFIFRKVCEALGNASRPLAAPPYAQPKQVPDLNEAARKWESTRVEMRSFIERCDDPEAPFIKFLFFFGTGTARDLMRLNEAHMTYHEVRFPA